MIPSIFLIPSKIKFSVYNITGQKVATLVDENQAAGSQKVSWNAANDLGQSMPSGIYRYRLQVNHLVLMKKMMLIQ